jgi:hypothetical protein
MTALRNPKALSDDAQVVYKGRTAVGAVSRRGRHWLALDIDGRSLGQFPTRLSAFAAVLKGGRDQQ